MFNTTHISVGLALGRKISNPIIAFLVGFASHFLMDAIPHWDGDGPALEDGKITPRGRVSLSADGFFTLIVLIIAWQLGWLGAHTYINVLAGALGAIFPDLLWIPYYFWRLNQPKIFFEFHKRIQKNIKFLPGMVPQIVLIIAAFWLGR